jgi:hypothetical protein
MKEQWQVLAMQQKKHLASPFRTLQKIVTF